MTAWTWLALAVTGYALALTVAVSMCRAAKTGDACRCPRSCKPLTADELAWERELTDLST